MIIQFHTPKGIAEIESTTVTDMQLVALGLTRDIFTKLIPRDLATEVDELKVKITSIKETIK